MRDSAKVILCIESHACACGNRWTNSVVRHLNGGSYTNGPVVPEITYIDLEHFTRKHLKCFSCTDPALLRRDLPAPPPTAIDLLA